MTLLDCDKMGKHKKNALHRDIFVGGSHARIVRQTKQNAATLGVSMVVLGLPWELRWVTIKNRST